MTGRLPIYQLVLELLQPGEWYSCDDVWRLQRAANLDLGAQQISGALAYLRRLEVIETRPLGVTHRWYRRPASSAVLA